MGAEGGWHALNGNSGKVVFLKVSFPTALTDASVIRAS